MNKEKKISKVIGVALLAALLTGCASPSAITQPEASNTPAQQDETVEEAVKTAETNETSAQIPVLPGTLASSDLELESGKDILISSPGIYRLSGNYDDITITVNASEENIVSLVMDNLTITNIDKPVIYVESAGSVAVSPYTGSENTLTVSLEITENDGKNNAVIYSKDDLEIGGTGALNIIGQSSNGIQGNDDVLIHDCTLNINTGEKGIKVNETLRIESGNIVIDSGEDALHSDNEIVISGGNVTVSTRDDGIHADNAIDISDGTITLEECYEGIEAMNVIISGGTISIYAQDDGINAVAPDSEEQDGAKSNKQIADANVMNMRQPPDIGNEDFNPRNENMLEPPNGMQAPPDGEMREPPNGMTPPDNSGMMSPDQMGGGFNQQGGTLPDGMQRPQDGDMQQGQRNNQPRRMDVGNFGGAIFDNDGSMLSISGGSIYVNAGGDGIDSNGNLLISGGEIYVDGPSDGGNGAIDFNADAKITGGTIIAIGHASMATNLRNAELQASVLYCFDKTYDGGQTIEVKNASGDVILSMNAAKAFQSIVFSSPDIQVGETYTLVIGTDEYSVTVTDNVQTIGNASGMLF